LEWLKTETLADMDWRIQNPFSSVGHLRVKIAMERLRCNSDSGNKATTEGWVKRM
jgi:hypothetical protein